MMMVMVMAMIMIMMIMMIMMNLWNDPVEPSSTNSRGWDVIWRDLFVQIELGVDIASFGIK